MIKHRDFNIEPNDVYGGFEASHDNYDAGHGCDGSWKGSHPILYGKDIQDCIEQIDDWYEENEDD